MSLYKVIEGVRPIVVISASSVTCSTPPPFLDATSISEVGSSYQLGETVTYKCNSGIEHRVRTCTTNGWTGGTYACGRE